jgi:signal recognition particle subunit SRP54
MGESLERLEEFRPDGLASRILGFGDVVGLVKDFEEVVDEKKAEEDAQRMLEGHFDLSDFLEQIRTIKKMGPLQDVVEKLPFFSGGMPDGAVIEDAELVRTEAIINSMTPDERRKPEIINPSRQRRIAIGAGRKESDVADLLQKFRDMKDLLAVMGGGKVRGRMKRLKGLKKMLGGGLLPQLSGEDEPSFGPGIPPGMPEIRKGSVQSKKELDKRRKKSKQAKKARKKSRKN